MDEKYYKLQEIEIDTFELDAPVEIEKGVLLLDKTSKNVFLQLKLNLLKTDTSLFSSVSVNIDCMDDAMEIIGAISPYTFTYRDIFLNISKSFGEDNPILLEPRVRRVKVGINRVVFTDASTWQPTTNMFTPPKQELINSLKPELVKQFQRDIRNFSPAEKEKYEFIPERLEDYWLCTCGRPNSNDANICSRCSLSKEKVFYISAYSLQKNLDEHKESVRLEEEKARIASEKAKRQAIEKAKREEEEKARLLAEEKVRLQKANRKRSLTTISVVIVVGLIFVSIFVISPSIKYSRASNYFAENDYDNALQLFSSLGGYKNSEDMVTEIHYQNASDLLAKGNYDDAITILTRLVDYKDSSELIDEANYQKAFQLISDKNYLDAIEILQLLDTYKDS